MPQEIIVLSTFSHKWCYSFPKRVHFLTEKAYALYVNARSADYGILIKTALSKNSMNCGWRKEKQHGSFHFPPPVVIGSRLPWFVAEVWKTPRAISEVFFFFFWGGVGAADKWLLHSPKLACLLLAFCPPCLFAYQVLAPHALLLLCLKFLLGSQ